MKTKELTVPSECMETIVKNCGEPADMDREQTMNGRTGANGPIQQDIAIGERLGVLTFADALSYVRKSNLGFMHAILPSEC